MLMPGRGTAGKRTVPELSQALTVFILLAVVDVQSLISLRIVVLQADLEFHLRDVNP